MRSEVLVCPDCRRDLADPEALKCPACGWEGSRLDGVPVMLSSRDRASELFSRYLANYDRIAEDDLEVGIQGDRLQQLFNDRALGYLGDLAGRRVCDVGIGKGILFEKLRRGGVASLAGVDISMPYLRRFATAGDAHVVLANAENLPFRASFDLVIATDIAEHVLNIGDLMLSVWEALVPDGRFVVRVPYKDNMLQYARLAGCEYDMVHLRNFAEDNLEHLLTHTGFAVEAMHYDGFNADRARPWVMRTRAGRRAFHELMFRGLGGGERVERLNPRIGRRLMDPFVVTAVARRRSVRPL
jgi:SAM-dependent methyltransferase